MSPVPLVLYGSTSRDKAYFFQIQDSMIVTAQHLYISDVLKLQEFFKQFIPGSKCTSQPELEMIDIVLRIYNFKCCNKCLGLGYRKQFVKLFIRTKL